MRFPATRRARWLAPFAAAAVVAGATAGVPALAAGPSPDLPSLTAEQLIAKVARADVDGLSGTVRTSADLGLPALPSANGGDSALRSLLTGTHTLTVAFAGPEQQRIGVHGSLEETEVVHNGRDLWIYRSADQTAVHVHLPARGDHDASMVPRSPADLTPQALARHVLAAVRPSTAVRVDDSTRVAGRAAYELELAPKSDDSLIRRVEIAVDARTGVPLGVRVLARSGSKPAIDVEFTSVDFGRPAASTFRFTPPSGTKVTEITKRAKPAHAGPQTRTEHHFPVPTVLGSGWASVLEVRGVTLPRAPRASDGDRHDDESAATLRALLSSGKHVSGAYGTGTLWRTRLLTVLITDDGRLFVGAVTPGALEAAAAAAPR